MLFGLRLAPNCTSNTTAAGERGSICGKEVLTEGRGASLGYRGHTHEQTCEPRAGYVGHADAEDSGT
jgi:hypothetical protein